MQFVRGNKISSEIKLINKRTREHTYNLSEEYQLSISVYQENKVVSAKFTIHFERALSGFGSMFYCCEHTNWWTAVAYESKVSINIELSFVQRRAYGGKRFGVPDSTHTPRRALPPRKANRIAPVYSSKQTFSPSCTPYTRPLPPASCLLKRTARDCHVFPRYTLHFDL